MTIEQVFTEIVKERAYQQRKFGLDKQQSLPGFIAIMRSELREADEAWIKNKADPRQSPLEEILQVAATAVACLEKYGCLGSARATDDITDAQVLEERRNASLERFSAR